MKLHPKAKLQISHSSHFFQGSLVLRLELIVPEEKIKEKKKKVMGL